MDPDKQLQVPVPTHQPPSIPSIDNQLNAFSIGASQPGGGEPPTNTSETPSATGTLTAPSLRPQPASSEDPPLQEIGFPCLDEMERGCIDYSQQEIADFIGSRYFSSVKLVPPSHLQELKNNSYDRDSWLNGDPFLTAAAKHDESGVALCDQGMSSDDSSAAQRHVEEMLSQAASYLEQGEIGLATERLREAKQEMARLNDLPLLSKCADLCERAKDWIGAESFYSRILKLQPSDQHTRSMRRAILHKVDNYDNDSLLTLYQNLNAYVDAPEDSARFHRNLWTVYRYSVYNTLAIEGGSLTLEETTELLQRYNGRTLSSGCLATSPEISEKRRRDLKELYGMELAMKFLSTRPFELGDLTIENICELHRRVMYYVRPEIAGRMRDATGSHVSVGVNVLDSPEFVQSSMRDYLLWVNKSKRITLMDPVEFAAMAHYKFVFIHPFVDGNGRCARLLLNYFFAELCGLPFTYVKVDNKERYNKSLDMARAGDLRSHIRFLRQEIQVSLSLFLKP